MIAGGVNRVLHSFEDTQVKQFFSMLAENFPDGEIVFDAISRSAEDLEHGWTGFHRNNEMRCEKCGLRD